MRRLLLLAALHGNPHLPSRSAGFSALMALCMQSLLWETAARLGALDMLQLAGGKLRTWPWFLLLRLSVPFVRISLPPRCPGR